MARLRRVKRVVEPASIQPARIKKVSEFEKSVIRARQNLITLSKRDEKELARIYITAAGNAKAVVLTYPDKPLGKWTVKELLALAADLSGQFKTKLDKSLLEAAGIGTEAQAILMRPYLQKLPLEGLIPEKLLFRVPKEAVDAAYRRVWPDGMNLSKRLWKLGKNTDKGLEKIVLDSIARGTPASDPETIAQLERLLSPERLGVRTSLHGRNVSFDAARVLRTERTVSFREAQYRSALKNPGTLGIGWNLSGSHKIIDICDEYANHNEGLGTGVYKVSDVPVTPHPQCFCWTCEETQPLDEYADRVVDWINGKPDAGLDAYQRVYLKEVV